MYELKKIGRVFTSKFVGTGPSSYKKRIYRATVSQRLRNTGLWSCLQKTARCFRSHERVGRHLLSSLQQKELFTSLNNLQQTGVVKRLRLAVFVRTY